MDITEMADEQLLACAGTDPLAFEEFYRRHTGKVVRFAARRCSRPDEVPDLVAAVWLEIIESVPRFDRTRGRAVPWLLGIAANLTASEARRKKRQEQASARLGGQRLLNEDDYAGLEEEIDAVSVAANLREAISRLPRSERVEVELVAMDGPTPSEAATALGLASGTTRVRLARARKKLRRSLPYHSQIVPTATTRAKEV